MEEKEEIHVDEERLEKHIEGIEREILQKKEIPEEEKNKINKRVFENIIIADLIMVFLYFISLGALNIESKVFITDLKVFSMGFVLFAIILFERSYRKDSGTLCIHGIEVLALAILMLFSPYLYATYLPVFHALIAIASFLFAIYFVSKSIILYQKMKKNYYNKKNDISEIIKK